MKKRSILLVSSAFYPEISPRSFRATELAKEFCRQGHKVVVISKYRDFDYTELLNKYPVTLKMWRKPLFPAIPDLRRKPFSTISRVISRVLSLLFEYPGIEEMLRVKMMLKQESGYDLLISFAVPFPIHWGVAWSWSEKHRIAQTWIADCGDPYMFARLDSFRKPFYFKFPEVSFCRKCDYIIVPFKAMKSQFYPQFINKIRVIPQGVNFDEIKLYDSPVKNNMPVFIFAGSVIPGKRDLSLFIDFLATLPDDFLFIVYTNKKEWLNAYRKKLGNKLEIHGYIDRLSLIYEMSKADFLVNVDTVMDTQLNTEAIPSKLIDYALADRPILNINSAHFNKEMVLKFLNKDYSDQRLINKSDYNIKRVSLQFLDLIK